VTSELRGTTEQQLIHLTTHWGSRYEFTAPENAEQKWTAMATFGDHDELAEETATDLLLAVRRHYEANRPEIT
jgi:hypothetical protein